MLNLNARSRFDLRWKRVARRWDTNYNVNYEPWCRTYLERHRATWPVLSLVWYAHTGERFCFQGLVDPHWQPPNQIHNNYPEPSIMDYLKSLLQDEALASQHDMLHGNLPQDSSHGISQQYRSNTENFGGYQVNAILINSGYGKKDGGYQKEEAFKGSTLNFCNLKYNNVYYMNAPSLLPNVNKNQSASVLNIAVKTIRLVDTMCSNKTTSLTSHFWQHNLLNQANIMAERFKGLNNPQIYKYEFSCFFSNGMFPLLPTLPLIPSINWRIFWC